MRLFVQEPERALWRELRGGRLGVPFRRQVVLGNPYIADFVAPALRLVVEVDGDIHAWQGTACVDVRRCTPARPHNVPHGRLAPPSRCLGPSAPPPPSEQLEMASFSEL
jgi:hypothetical protein